MGLFVGAFFGIGGIFLVFDGQYLPGFITIAVACVLGGIIWYDDNHSKSGPPGNQGGTDGDGE